MIKKEMLQDLCNAAALAGFTAAEASALDLVVWPKSEGHVPVSLPKGMAAIYIFECDGEYLKVGKVGARSGARYQSQHYTETSSRSNLAKSLVGDARFREKIGDMEAGQWIRENTTRYNILILESWGKEFVNFAEAFFILKCRPRFESSGNSLAAKTLD